MVGVRRDLCGSSSPTPRIWLSQNILLNYLCPDFLPIWWCLRSSILSFAWVPYLEIRGLCVPCLFEGIPSACRKEEWGHGVKVSDLLQSLVGEMWIGLDSSGEAPQSTGIEAVQGYMYRRCWTLTYMYGICNGICTGGCTGGVGHFHGSLSPISLFKWQHIYHAPENISKVNGSSKGIWSGNLTSGLPTESNSNITVGIWLSRLTCLHCSKNN